MKSQKEQLSPQSMEYRANRLTQDLGRCGHYTFNQLLRSVWMEIFGHEALVDIKDLAVITHCTVINADVYRLAKLPSSAWRKLLNPFKWVELMLTAPVAVFRYGFNEMYWQFKCRIWKAIWTALQALCMLIDNIGLSIVRRILAPVRYIIRPSIELAHKKPKLFFIVALVTAVAIVFATMLIMGKFNFNLIIHGIDVVEIVLGMSTPIKVGIVAGFALTVWATTLMIVIALWESFAVLENTWIAPPGEEQTVSQFVYAAGGTTAVITEKLHGLNSTITEMREEQGCGYTAALFFGIEALVYPALSTAKNTDAQVEYIPFTEVQDYAENRKIAVWEDRRLAGPTRPCYSC